MVEDRQNWNRLADSAEARVEAWIIALATENRRADVLDAVRRDSDAFGFTRRLLDAVVSASDPFVAALGLREMSRELPGSMPAVEKAAVRAGGIASLGLPWAVLPIARKWLRDRVAHLVLSTELSALEAASHNTSSHSDSHNANSESRRNTSRNTSHNTSSEGAKKRTKLPAELRAALAADPDTLLALGGLSVLGAAGVQRELRRLSALAARPEVTRLAVDVGRLVPRSSIAQASMWALDADGERGAEILRRLLETAAEHETEIVLESSDYRGALLAPLLLARALGSAGLERAGLETVRAGVSLPAELPESLQAAGALVQISRERVARGAAPLEVTVRVAGLGGKEQIASILGGLPVPSLSGRDEQAAQWLRVVALLLAAGDAVRVVAASEDAHLLAAATVLADALARPGALTLQLRAGIAPALERVIADNDFAVRRRLPLLDKAEFDGAVDSLIALAAETADEASALAQSSALLGGDFEAKRIGADHLREAALLAAQQAPESHRVQRRDREWSETARDTVAFYRAPGDSTGFDTGGLTAAVLGLTRAQTGAITLDASGPAVRVPVISPSGFAHEADTDASRYENRQWVRTLLVRASESNAGVGESLRAAEAVETPQQLEALVDVACTASATWSEQRASERGRRVARLALATASARDRLIEVLAAETGAPMHVIDAEVNGTIDAARYLGQLAGGLGAVRGAEFQPDQLIVVVAGAGVPLAERAEAMLAALAAGSSVLLLAHPTVVRSSAVLIEEWRVGGLPEGVITLATSQGDAGEAEGADAFERLGVRLVADSRVDRLLVLGRREIAEALLRRRPDLRLEGRFRGMGAVLIAPSADPTLAVQHAVASAFGASQGDARIARALVLLGGTARSMQLRELLAEAVRALPVGDTLASATSASEISLSDGEGDSVDADSDPGDPVDPLSFAVGPLPEPPTEAGLRALTELGPGEEWLVQPERLDEAGRLWRPGVRVGVPRSSSFWRDAIGMPVIGVITAQTFDEAISLVNRLGGGGVAALHASDPSETLPWLERARAASLSLNRATTGTRIERQPGGGWGETGMGLAPLAGGPNRLLPLGSWKLREGTASSTLHLRGLSPEVKVLIEATQPTIDYLSFDRVRRAALADALAWRTTLGGLHDVGGLGIERNLLRRRPLSTHIRLAEQAPLAELVRVIAAGLLVGAPMTVSTGMVLPPVLSDYLDLQGIAVSLERDEAWLERVAVSGPSSEGLAVSRVRLIGGDRARTAEWMGGLGEVALWAEPVTMAGPVELLAFLREQSVSITAHRHSLALLPAGIGGWIAELQGRVGRV